MADDGGSQAAAKPCKRVSFPEDDGKLVTGYLEPVNPWQDVGVTSADELANLYLDSCQKHNTEPIKGVVDQIKGYNEALSGVCRVNVAPCLSRLHLSCAILGISAADALEAILRKVQFDRFDIDHCTIDDDTAVSLFDMIEYYESAVTFSICGDTDFGIRGWQACSRMIKKSQRLRELEARGVHPGEAHSAVLGRALRANDCRLRALRLPRANLSSRPLLCLVSALKHNTSIRELQLCDNGLGVEDAEQLGSLLCLNNTLQLLDISNNDIQDVGLGHITDGLVQQGILSSGSSCQGICGSSPSSPSSPEGSDGSPLAPQSGCVPEKGLAVLVLWNNNLTRNCANHLSRALRSRSLCVLNVGQNALGSEAVRALAHALRPSARETAEGGWRAPQLLCLGLQAARLGAPAAVAVADVLRDNSHIQRIDLRDNRLQLIGLQALAAAMDANTTATQIDLDDIPIQESIPDSAEMCKLCARVRDACNRNEAQRNAALHDGNGHSAKRRKRSLIAERKISLTCQTLYSREEDAISKQSTPIALEPVKRTEKVRWRSPLPSPVPSPISSPVPSPSRTRSTNRFHVSRVNADSPIGSDRSSTDSSSPSTPTQSARQAFFGSSRFKVVQVSERDPPPAISVQPPSEAPSACVPSRFSVTRNLDSAFDPRPADVPSVINNIVGLTHDLGNLIEETKANTLKALQARKMNEVNRVPEVDNSTKETLPMSIVTVEAKLKKNKSESSLDSPDLEVSRYMDKQKRAFYDSNSSLDVSGSSVESLNCVDIQSKKPELLPTSENLQESTDSGFEHSEKAAETPHESASSNEGTLTYNSPEAEKPKRTSSLLDVPSMNSNRVRKISWVAPSPSFSSALVQTQTKPDVEESAEQAKGPSNLEKLLSLFQHPSSLFTKSAITDDIQGSAKADSAVSGFWSWGLASHLQTSASSSRSETPDRLRTTQSVDRPILVTDEAPSQPPTVQNDIPFSIAEDMKKVDLNSVDDKLGVSVVRPRTFASVLKEDDVAERVPANLDAGDPVDNLPSCVLIGIKENISPENTVTKSMSNAQIMSECRAAWDQADTLSDNGSVDIAKDALVLLSDEKGVLKKASSAEGIIETASVDPKLVKFTPTEDSFEMNSDSVFELPTRPMQAPKRTNRKGRSPSKSPFDHRASGSSPKSLPDTFTLKNRYHDTLPKTKKVSTLGKMARDSLYALNMTEEDIAEFRHSSRLTSVESLRSFESVSEDARLRTSQESLMSLDSISEDGRSTVSEGDAIAHHSDQR